MLQKHGTAELGLNITQLPHFFHRLEENQEFPSFATFPLSSPISLPPSAVLFPPPFPSLLPSVLFPPLPPVR